jgi:hypothetical protein
MQNRMYNTINTRNECGLICMKSYILNEPFNKPDGFFLFLFNMIKYNKNLFRSLNDCL